VKKTEAALGRLRHSYVLTALRARAKSLRMIPFTLSPHMSWKGVCGNSLDAIPT